MQEIKGEGKAGCQSESFKLKNVKLKLRRHHWHASVMILRHCPAGSQTYDFNRCGAQPIGRVDLDVNLLVEEA